MAIQWVSCFEMGGSGNTTWDRIFWSDPTNAGNAAFNQTVLNETPEKTGGVAATISATPSSPNFSLGRYVSRNVSDAVKLIYCGGCHVDTKFGALPTDFAAIFSGSDRISFGVNGNFAALYVNGTIGSTSSIDVITCRPWLFFELYQNKTDNKIYLKINGVDACNVDLPLGWAATSVGMNPGRRVGGNPAVRFSHVMTYDGVDPLGPVMSREYFKTGNITNNFASVGSPNLFVNTAPFTNTAYRNSETTGHVDLFSYTNILPADTPLTSIVAVVHQAVAASGGVSGGSLNLRTRLGASNYDTSVSASLISTTPVLVQKVWETNPQTLAAWTRAQVQAIQTGYVVAA